jgi:hypothetical protein
MLKVIAVTAISALALAVTAAPQPAFAHDGGAVAAGVIGGLAVGAIIGSQADRGYYGGPGYYQSGYQPSYRECHIERQQVEDGYGNLRMRRIRVCD